VALFVLLLGGCGRIEAANADSPPSPPSYYWPAAAAGPACGLLDFGTVASELGTAFDTAGGAQVDNTVTCAVTQAGHDYPELSVSLSGSTVDDLLYAYSIEPAGATPVKKLGRAAYLLEIAADAHHGPGLEYGWLSAKPRLGVVRYTFATGAQQADVDAMAPKLLKLAQRVEKTP
jgi:hypothetical protein